MNRKVLAFVLCFSLVLMVVGCSNPSSSTPTGSSSTAPFAQTDADNLTATVMSAVASAASSAMSSAMSIHRTISSSSEADVLNQLGVVVSSPNALGSPRTVYNGNGVTINISAISTGDTLTMTFSNYTASGVTIVSGNITETITTGSSESMSYSGSFDINYSGTAYTYTISLTESVSTTSTYTISGSYSINGYSYTYAGSSSTTTTPTTGGNSGSTTTSSSTTGISFWSPEGSLGYISCYVNNTLEGTLTSYWTSAPGYGASGTVTVSLSPGTYSISAKAQNGSTWGPTSVTLTQGEELQQELQ